jgi:acyl dehydratase
VFDFAVGQSAAISRSFSREDVQGFATLIGTLQNAMEVPHGLVGGLFSTLLGTQLPGRGTNWMKQTLCFYTHARVGETLTATVEITRLRPEKQLVNLRCRCHATDGKLVCEGDALVMAREML